MDSCHERYHVYVKGTTKRCFSYPHSLLLRIGLGSQRLIWTSLKPTSFFHSPTVNEEWSQLNQFSCPQQGFTAWCWPTAYIPVLVWGFWGFVMILANPHKSGFTRVNPNKTTVVFVPTKSLLFCALRLQKSINLMSSAKCYFKVLYYVCIVLNPIKYYEHI